MKAKVIIFSIALLITVVISTTLIMAAGSGPYPEPPNRTAGLPDSAVWNPETGAYYDANEFIWDSKAHKYIPISKNRPPHPAMGVNEWVNSHKNSINVVDQTIIRYFNELQNYYNVHPELKLSSKWEVGQNGGPLTILTNLNVTNIPKMLAYIKSGNPDFLNAALMIAISEMLQVQIGNIDLSDAGISQWHANFKNKAQKILDQKFAQ